MKRRLLELARMIYWEWRIRTQRLILKTEGEEDMGWLLVKFTLADIPVKPCNLPDNSSYLYVADKRKNRRALLLIYNEKLTNWWLYESFFEGLGIRSKQELKDEFISYQLYRILGIKTIL